MGKRIIIKQSYEINFHFIYCFSLAHSQIVLNGAALGKTYTKSLLYFINYYETIFWTNAALYVQLLSRLAML